MRLLASSRTPRLLPAVAAALAVLAAASLGTAPARAATGESVVRASEVSTVGVQIQGLPTGWRGQMLTQVNAMRASGGVAPLQPCASLRRAAQDYATVMAQTNVFGHVGSDGSAPWDRMRAKGFSWRAAAENIASGQRSIAQVMQEWAQSPDHLAILMDPRMRQVGFGFAVDAAAARTYWVQDFGWGTGC